MGSQKDLYDRIEEAAKFIRRRVKGKYKPRTGIVLGSGLGAFADGIKGSIAINYKDIPYFEQSGVKGHAGRFVIGKHGKEDVAVMQGRIHYYEGHDIKTITFPVRVMLALGIKTFILTNAAGGINRKYTPGDIVAITDHINFTGVNPLRGHNDERLGPRFPDMSEPYCKVLQRLAEKVARKNKISLKKGVYVMSLGPSYETPSEIRAYGRCGADVVGMSTVPETVVINHGGGKVLGFSCVTNMAAGISKKPLSHQEVTETSERVGRTFVKLIGHVIEEIGRQKHS
ncbi:MAG: purine-nucleoside phosphorylase [Oligoflexales bacterium]|nr:purine-nucleoside phosphorylase [Oligoflexales bacterium]